MTEAQRRVLYEIPKTRDRLADWVEAFLGFKLNRSCRCIPQTPNEKLEWEKEGKREHQSQLDYVESGFFNLHSQCVYMACRNAGKSQCAAILTILDAFFKPGIKIAIASFTRGQAEFIYRYIESFLNFFEKLIGKRIAHRTSDVITFTNGSIAQFFSGGKSEADVSGFRPSVLFVDEADKFSQQKFDGIANCLEAGGDLPSRFDVLSTNYTLDGEGVVLKMIERYDEFNKVKAPSMLPARVFVTCILDVMDRCDDRYSCYNKETKAHCPLWTYCKGKAKEGGGFLKIDKVIERAISTSRPDFEAEYMLWRPSSEYSYFPDFSIAEHVLDPDRPLDPYMLTLIAFDFGAGRCPHGAVIMQKDKNGNYFVVDEFEMSCSLEVFCDVIKEKYPNITDADCFYDPAGNRKEGMLEAKSYAQVLRAKGFYPRCKQLKRRQTFELVNKLISPAVKPAKLHINKRCKKLIRQIQAAEHAVLRGRATPEPADGKGDDLLDCTRYIIGWTSGTYAKHAGAKKMLWF